MAYISFVVGRCKAKMRWVWWSMLWVGWLVSACGVVEESGHHGHTHSRPPDADLSVSRHELIQCTESQATGYRQGVAFTITVVQIDGKPVEKSTANAYAVMRDAASQAGVTLRVVSGFRTMSEQQYLYNCYRNCNCNNCNLAARPGYSNHQSGHALDLNTSTSGVYNWLAANAGRFGFQRTVSSEPWHWEWWGGGPGGGPCGSCQKRCDGSVIVDEKCGRGDCATFGARCVSDNLGVRCASVFCPNQGTKQVCVNDKLIGTCKDGAISTGDCSVFGASCVADSLGARCVFGACPAQGKKNVCLSDREIGQCDNGKFEKGDCGAFGMYCSIAGVQSARCVSVFCVAGPHEVPQKHSVCLPNGEIGHCDDQGGIKAEPCAAGKVCASSPTVRCIGASKPRGHLDAATCEAVKGWSQDPDEASKSIDVHVYFKGPAGDPEARGISLLADKHREDLCKNIGSCPHGFELDPPYSLFNQRPHAVHAYGIDSEGGANAELADSPRTLQCSLPPLQGVKRLLSDPKTFETWGFSLFWDVLPAPDSAFASLPLGTPLPNKPQLVRADDQKPHVWLIDGLYRRHVASMKILLAWHFDPKAVAIWPASTLYAYLEGTPLRARPMLAEDSQGAIYLFDDPQPKPPVNTEIPSPPDAQESSPSEPTNDAGIPQDAAQEGAAEQGDSEPNAPPEATTEVLLLENSPDTGTPHRPPVQGCQCQSASPPSFSSGLFWLALFLLGYRRKRR